MKGRESLGPDINEGDRQEESEVKGSYEFNLRFTIYDLRGRWRALKWCGSRETEDRRPKSGDARSCRDESFVGFEKNPPQAPEGRNLY